jgi:large subunit ribosomal protein L16
MGGGKGPPDHWVAVVKPGRILFEMGGVSEEMAREAMHLASYKLPIHTKFVLGENDVTVDSDSVGKELEQVEG